VGPSCERILEARGEVESAIPCAVGESLGLGLAARALW
jgi:hypothetical protein